MRAPPALRNRLPLLLVAICLGGGCLPDRLTASLFTSAAPRPDPTADDCERCHQEVFREWTSSHHARAFTSEGFQRASASGREPRCLGCHAAGPVRGDGPPQVRASHRAEGVTCVTCHLSADPDAAPLTMRGPESRTSPIEIHPIVEGDPLYRSSELCGTCHVETLREWRDAPEEARGEEKPTCQACHMPSVRRKMESVHDEHAYSALFTALGEDRELRRHTFDVPEFQEDQIRLRAALGAEGLEVEVENLLPHALPTGSFGRRELRLLARGPEGESSETRSRRLRGPLASGETWRTRLVTPPDVLEGPPESASVELQRYDAASDRWHTLGVTRAEPPAG